MFSFTGLDLWQLIPSNEGQSWIKRTRHDLFLQPTLTLLDHGLDIADAGASLDVDGQGLAGKGLHEELHLD